MSLNAVVLISTISSHYGGPTYSVRRLWQTVMAHDVKVTVHSTDSFHVPESIADRELWKPLVCHRWPTVGLKALGYSKQMFSGVLSSIHNGSSVISQHGLWLHHGRLARNIGKQLNVPVIVHPHGMLDPWTLQQSRWKKRIAGTLWEYRNLKRAACLRVTSEEELKAIRGFGLKTPSVLIPNGIDVMNYVNLPSREIARTRLPDLSDDRRVLLFLSRVHPVKGLPMLINAWKNLAAERKDWVLAIAGPDEYGQTKKVERMISELGLQQSVRLLGPLLGEDKLAAYSLADVFVLPSYSENFGVAVAEALSSGLPVITTKGTPWKGLEKHGCGWWIEANAHALTTALMDATALSKKELAEMGERGRAWMKRDYSWNAIAVQMKEVCEWMLGGGAAPDCVFN